MSKIVLKVIIVVLFIIAALVFTILKQEGVLRIISVFLIAILAIARVAWKAVDKEDDDSSQESNDISKV
jgi:hypothetical protein